eukprot:tig00000615_g2613.t1
MFEGIIKNVLDKYAKEYFSNLDKTNLDIGLFSGEVVLDNLEINPKALDNISVPFKIVSGFVHKVHIVVPWTSLSSSAIRVNLDGVYMVIKVQADPAKSAARGQEDKRAALQKFGKTILTTLYPPTEGERKAPPPLVEKIIDNIEINIANIHIRIEDDDTRNEAVLTKYPIDPTKKGEHHYFALGITLPSFQLTTDKSRGKAVKLLRLHGLAYYLDYKPQRMLSREALSVPIMMDFFQSSQKSARVAAESQYRVQQATAAKHHDYILSPIAVRGEIVAEYDAVTGLMFDVKIGVLDPVTLTTDKRQFDCLQALGMAIASFNRYGVHHAMRPKRRPQAGPQTPHGKNRHHAVDEANISSARAWWRFAKHCIATDIAQGKRPTFKTILEKIRKREKYVHLATLYGKEKIKELRAQMNKIEEELTTQEICMYRMQVAEDLVVEGLEVAVDKSGRPVAKRQLLQDATAAAEMMAKMPQVAWRKTGDLLTGIDVQSALRGDMAGAFKGAQDVFKAAPPPVVVVAPRRVAKEEAEQKRSAVREFTAAHNPVQAKVQLLVRSVAITLHAVNSRRRLRANASMSAYNQEQAYQTVVEKPRILYTQVMDVKMFAEKRVNSVKLDLAVHDVAVWLPSGQASHPLLSRQPPDEERPDAAREDQPFLRVAMEAIQVPQKLDEWGAAVTVVPVLLIPYEPGLVDLTGFFKFTPIRYKVSAWSGFVPPQVSALLKSDHLVRVSVLGVRVVGLPGQGGAMKSAVVNIPGLELSYRNRFFLSVRKFAKHLLALRARMAAGGKDDALANVWDTLTTVAGAPSSPFGSPAPTRRPSFTRSGASGPVAGRAMPGVPPIPELGRSGPGSEAGEEVEMEDLDMEEDPRAHAVEQARREAAYLREHIDQLRRALDEERRRSAQQARGAPPGAPAPPSVASSIYSTPVHQQPARPSYGLGGHAVERGPAQGESSEQLIAENRRLRSRNEDLQREVDELRAVLSSTASLGTGARATPHSRRKQAQGYAEEEERSTSCLPVDFKSFLAGM